MHILSALVSMEIKGGITFRATYIYLKIIAEYCLAGFPGKKLQLCEHMDFLISIPAFFRMK